MLGEGLAVASALLWAISSVLYAKGLEEVEPFRANVIRAAPAFLVLFAASLITGSLREVASASAESLIATVISAVFAFFLGDTFFMVAIKVAGVAVGVATSYTYPLFVALVAATLLGEALTPPDFAGAAAIVGGIALISFGKENASGSPIGIGVVLPGVAAAISWAISISVLKIALASLSPLTLNVIRLALISAVLPLVVKGTRSSWRSLGYLAVGGILALGVGVLAFLKSIELVGAGIATPLSALAPMFSAVGGFAAGEKITWRVAFGVALCTLGAVLVSLP